MKTLSEQGHFDIFYLLGYGAFLLPRIVTECRLCWRFYFWSIN